MLAGVNFTNVLQSAFAHADPESAKKTDNLTVFFSLLGSGRAKAACGTLVKLTPGYQVAPSLNSTVLRSPFYVINSFILFWKSTSTMLLKSVFF